MTPVTDAQSTCYIQNSTITQEQVYKVKLVLLGESSVGKSSLVSRFVNHQFSPYQKMTLSSAFFRRTIGTDDAMVEFEIWDTAGSERFHSMTPQYYRNARAAVIVYDIQTEHSFTRAQRWVDELRDKVPEEFVIALVGNKLDLVENRKVGFGEAVSYADANGLLFMETSAKTGYNVYELFQEVAKKLPKKGDCAQDQNIRLSENSKKIVRKSCCAY